MKKAKVARRSIAAEVRSPSTCAEDTKRKSKFRLGQTVQLVTGSFVMVVTGIEKAGMVACVSCSERSDYLSYHRLPEAGLRVSAPKRAAEPSKDPIPF